MQDLTASIGALTVDHNEIDVSTCQYRKIRGDKTPCCQVAADIADLPVEGCTTNDDACDWCMNPARNRIPPQVPNPAVASAAMRGCAAVGRIPPKIITDALRSNAKPVTLDSLPCIFRGQVLGQLKCKPCSAGADGVLVDQFACSVNESCTLKNTGTSPKVQGCVTCEKRVAEQPKLHAVTIPQSVRDAMRANRNPGIPSAQG